LESDQPKNGFKRQIEKGFFKASQLLEKSYA